MQIFKAITEPSGKLSKYLNSLSNGASKAGVVILVADVAIALYKGDFGVATGKIYKYVMGKRVPWASMIGALQEFVELVLPGSAKNNGFFKLLRALDPIGLGEKGVDSVVTSLCCLVQYVLGDKTGSNQKLQKLGARLEKGPTAIFAGIPDWSHNDVHLAEWFSDVFHDEHGKSSTIDKQKLMQMKSKYDKFNRIER